MAHKIDPVRAVEIRRLAKNVLVKLREWLQARAGGPIEPLEMLPIQPRDVAAMMKLKYQELEEIPNPTFACANTRVDGMFDRDSSVLAVAERQGLPRMRFTAAHELGHFLLDLQLTSLREAAIDSSDSRVLRMPGEDEADLFATELLMPDKLVSAVYIEYFGRSFSANDINEDEAYQLTWGRLSPSELRALSSLQRASVFAGAKGYGGSQFPPLTEVFGVSTKAMSRRLVELNLVS